jgi:hypothetical protein
MAASVGVFDVETPVALPVTRPVGLVQGAADLFLECDHFVMLDAHNKLLVVSNGFFENAPRD